MPKQMEFLPLDQFNKLLLPVTSNILYGLSLINTGKLVIILVRKIKLQRMLLEGDKQYYDIHNLKRISPYHVYLNCTIY